MGMPPLFKGSGLILGLVFPALTNSTLHAQQFVEETFRLPSQSFYSNQLSVCDFDLDGDLDFAVADGQGYTSQGSALQVRLYVNDGSGNFTDESSIRAAGVTGWFRGVEFGDCDGDGDPDMILAQDYYERPRLLINDGTGVFEDQTIERLPDIRLSSARAQFADVDGDNDLDIAFCDSGSTSRFGSNGRSRLYINDGTGHYLDQSGARFLGGSVMSQQMDALFFDADDDLDLDLYIATRSSGTANSSRLWTNNGSGVFASSLTAGTDYSTYSFDAGDIDGDADLDIIGANAASGNREKLVRNDPGSVWTDITTSISPNPSADDNDSKFFDVDNDGDLDLLIAVLYGSRERIYLNDGSGAFTQDSSLISAVSDATLDIAVADFTGDGRADIITVQGEGGSFQNRFYRNTGPADTRPPIIEQVTLLDPDEDPPSSIRTRLSDAYTSDRGFDPAYVRIEISLGSSDVKAHEMFWVGNSIWSHPVDIQECQGVVTYRILASDRAGNAVEGPWISADLSGSSLAGDLNSDNVVNGADVAIILGYWGSSFGCADTNGDGVVGGPDLATVLANYGSSL